MLSHQLATKVNSTRYLIIPWASFFSSPSRPLIRPRPSSQFQLGWISQQRRNISLQELDEAKGSRTRVVILGSGWAGYTLARGLNTKMYQPVIVSPRPYFIFTPLLASTAVGTLEPRCAMENVRVSKGGYGGLMGRVKRSLGWKGGVEYYQGWCDGVDFEKGEVRVEEAVEREKWEKPRPKGGNGSGDNNNNNNKQGENLIRDAKLFKPTGKVFSLKYDKLVIAVGCYAQTFGIPGVVEHAFFLKDVGDARKIRRRILECFERASLPTTTEEEKDSLLHFAIVGGGPTGVEFAAELHDLTHDDLSRLFPSLVPHLKITVYDVAPRILSMFDESLASYALSHFRRQNIDIQTSHHITKVTSSPSSASNLLLHTKEEGPVPCGLLVWSTGLAMNPFVTSLASLKKDPKAGRIIVDTHLRVSQSIQNVYALGDCAHIPGHDLPATAQVANQQARYLRKALNRSPDQKNMDATAECPEFKFAPRGVMAYIGSWSAIKQGSGDLGGKGKGRVDLRGRIAWVLWRTAYLSMSVSWRNRVLIPVFWVVNWLWGRDVNRF